MIPIYEQGGGKGIGIDHKEFVSRFEQILDDHSRNRRAKAFAFIFYNFKNADLKRVLKDEGVFVKLDRLSGKDLSVFFVHASGSMKTIEAFNKVFLSKLKLTGKAKPPCVVFFKVEEGIKISDVLVANLDSTDLIHGFQELYEVVGRYIRSDSTQEVTKTRHIIWRKAGAFVSKETFKAGLKVVVQVIEEYFTKPH